VHPEHRSRGVGSTLVQLCEQEARRLKHPFLYLNTRRAEGFYERLGWVTMDTLTWDGETVAVMRRPSAR
jgi:N-acetylglutamate synthase-like GNAT family acetyltransferase